MNKFENVDVIASLQAVMKQNTTHYQSDFQYDADLFRAAAKSADSMEKTFLWLSRPDGTYCERERDALLRDTAQHLEWSTYGGASETLLAFAVKIDGMERGKVKGSLYQLDYAAHAGHLKEIALPRHHATLTFEDGAKRTCSLQDYPGHQNAIMARYGKIAAVRYEPADAGQLAALLRAEQEGRETLAPGRIGDHSGIGEHKLRELMDTGEIEFVQNGNRRLLCENAIWDWYNRNKVPVRVAREA